MRPVVLVLVGTKSPGNVGAVCRIAKAFGLAGVRLVAPEADPRDPEARRLAHGAEDVLDAARTFPGLRDALAGCMRSAGTTARARHWSRPVRHPAEAAGAADARPDAPYAVVFGPEDHGLGNEHLAACDEILSVPLPPDTGATLSLPAACAIVCHELSAAAGWDRPLARGARAEWGGHAADSEELDALLDEITAALDLIGFRPVPDAVRFRGTLRDFLARAHPTRGDRRILRHVAAQVGKWKRRVRGEILRQEDAARRPSPEERNVLGP
jgi:TrmH family RNA methyltransferase